MREQRTTGEHSTASRQSRRLRETAFHEAGHAMAAWRLFMPFRYVTIEPCDDSRTLGHVLMEKASDRIDPEVEMTPRTRDWLERDILTLLAGPEAARGLSGRYNHVGASRDYRDAAYLADYVTQDFEKGDEHAAYMKWLRLRARRLVAFPPNWSAISALTAELLNRRRIRAPEARRILLAGAQAAFPKFNESKRRSVAAEVRS